MTGQVTPLEQALAGHEKITIRGHEFEFAPLNLNRWRDLISWMKQLARAEIKNLTELKDVMTPESYREAMDAWVDCAVNFDMTHPRLLNLLATLDGAVKLVELSIADEAKRKAAIEKVGIQDIPELMQVFKRLNAMDPLALAPPQAAAVP